MTTTPWILTEVHRNPDCLEWIITVFELQPPTSDEVASLLRRWLKTEAAIQQIATFACGNMRMAFKDADLQFAAENP